LKKIIKELERFYCKLTDYFLLTENFHKYQIKHSKIYSNDYILNENQFSFVHPPKSAGTSVNSFLYENNIDLYVSAHNLVSKKCDPKKFRYITVIRDPVKRIKSFYEMQLNDKRLAFHNQAKKGLNYFVTKVRINQNCLCKFLIGDLSCDIDEEKFERAKNNLKSFFFIIDFDNLEKDMKLLKLKLNIKKPMKHLGKRKKEKIYYTEDENNDIIVNNTFDIKLWDYFKKNIRNLS